MTPPTFWSSLFSSFCHHFGAWSGSALAATSSKEVFPQIEQIDDCTSARQ